MIWQSPWGRQFCYGKKHNKINRAKGGAGSRSEGRWLRQWLRGGGVKVNLNKGKSQLQSPTHPNEFTESCHQLSRKERQLHRENLDKGEKEGLGTLGNKVASCPSQLCLQGRLERLGGGRSAGEKNCIRRAGKRRLCRFMDFIKPVF